MKLVHMNRKESSMQNQALRNISLAAVLAFGAATASGCAEDSGELEQAVIAIDEPNASSAIDLLERSSTIAIVSLESIEPGPVRGGGTPDEVGAEFVEAEELQFSVVEYLRGDGPDTIAFNWDAYLVENSNGEPGERYAEVSVQGVNFDETSLGDSYVLFMSDEYGDRLPVTISDGIALLNDDGSLAPTSNTGVLSRDDLNVDLIRTLL